MPLKSNKYVYLFFIYVITFVPLIFSNVCIQIASGINDNLTIILEDTVLESDLILEGNKTMKIMDCVFTVKGTTELRNHAKLVLSNVTFETYSMIINEFSQLTIDSSNYSWGARAFGFSVINVNNSNLMSTDQGQLFELSEGSTISINNSTSERLLIRLLGQSDATVHYSGPSVSIQTMEEGNIVEVKNSVIPFLSVYGNTITGVSNSSLGEVIVAHSGVLEAENCVITEFLAYYDYHATVKIKDCFVTSLIDGVIYEDKIITLTEDDLFQYEYKMGVENINSTVIDTKYILFLLGEYGIYDVYNISANVLNVLIEGSVVFVKDVNLDDLIFYIGGDGILNIKNSKFNKILAMKTLFMQISDCRLNNIQFTDDIVDEIQILDSRIFSREGPSISGGWVTNLNLTSSLLSSPENSPDIDVQYFNKLIMRDIPDVDFTGTMGVAGMIFDSEVTFSKIGIELVYNDLNRSTIRFVDGANYTRYLINPSKIVLMDLVISPKRAKPGEYVNITATVRNIGDLTGIELLELKMDSQVVGNATVTLQGGESEKIKFELQNEEMGKHVLEILNETVSFHIIDPNSPEELLRRYWYVVTIIIIVIALFILRTRKR